MRKSLAIVIMCCVFALMLGLVACGGNSGSASGSASSAASSSSSEDPTVAEAKAALEEGQGYWFGNGANGYDKEKARAAFKKAADLGNGEGWYWLGAIEQNGTSADRWPQVIDYYQKAIDNGCAKGYCGLGSLYRTGYGFEKDVAKAKELYEQASAAGEVLGDLNIGYLYQKGEGVEESGTKAQQYYEKGLNSEEYFIRNAARCDMGSLYSAGSAGVEANGDKSKEWYQKAADENYAAGWSGLGAAYSGSGQVHEQGEGVEGDNTKAIQCYEKQAALGSYYNLGVQYQNGWGTEVDYEKAAELFQKDIDGGKDAANSMTGMAILYCNGTGVERDLDTATDLCNRALDAAGPGDDLAIEQAHRVLDWIAGQ